MCDRALVTKAASAFLRGGRLCASSARPTVDSGVPRPASCAPIGFGPAALKRRRAI
ncbi:hypothetical protein HMPREF0972_01336 [Actinomyces sp. oral taxon 848 str. F0332]|nr:hypothetical protein HMPREF0972_01336 [Actinomyces sp. oral taxon 848 str. F0332]